MFRLSVFLLAMALAIVHGRGHGSSSSEENKAFNWRTPLDLMLDMCLAQISNKSVDVVVDLGSSGSNEPFLFHQKRHSRPKPSRHLKDVAQFVESVGRTIPGEKYVVIIFDGTGENQSKYFIDIPSQPPTTAPSFIWGGRPMPLPSIGRVVRDILYRRDIGYTPQGLPTSKDPSTPATAFTVVITDGKQKTPLSSYPNPESTAIIDLTGALTIENNKEYRNRNILLAARPGDLKHFEQTVRLQICQAISQ